MEGVGLVLDARNFLAEAVQLARVLRHGAQQGDSDHSKVGSQNDDVAHAPHQRLKITRLIDESCLGGLMHLVDGVVHRRDEIANVAAIEWRDKGASNGKKDIPRDYVGCHFRDA